jgi:APA family basic amino acid/polyamine antiporter
MFPSADRLVFSFATVVYILVAAGAVGPRIGGQPDQGAERRSPSRPARRRLGAAVRASGSNPRTPWSAPTEALRNVLRQIGFGPVGNALGVAAFLALPSVILVLIFGQTRSSS